MPAQGLSLKQRCEETADDLAEAVALDHLAEAVAAPEASGEPHLAETVLEAAAVSEAAAHSQGLSEQQKAHLSSNIKVRRRQKTQELRESLSVEKFQKFVQVRKLEKKYIQTLQIEHDTLLGTVRAAVAAAATASTSPSEKGFNSERQRERRQIYKDIMENHHFRRLQTLGDAELLRHGQALLEKGLDVDMEGVPLAEYSWDAIETARDKNVEAERSGSQPSGARPSGSQSSGARSSGSQPSRHAPDYAQLMAAEGLITLPADHKGRKPPVMVDEAPPDQDPIHLEYCELEPSAHWWMKLGGFNSPEHLDANNWSALHHALDAASYSCRALCAAIELMPLTPHHVINAKTTGSRPSGYTCLHLACDGSDEAFQRKSLVATLLDLRADIEARDAKENTPLLTASGTGVADVVACLLDARADVKARNSNNKSALDKAKASSGSTASLLEAAGARPTPRQETMSGRTRGGTSNQRQARNFRSQEEEFPWAKQVPRPTPTPTPTLRRSPWRWREGGWAYAWVTPQSYSARWYDGFWEWCGDEWQ